MPVDFATAQHHIVGGGIAGLAAAVFLCRDAGVRGGNIVIYEQSRTSGGSLDGSGDAEAGYLVRGGRMFERNFACTFDLLDSIPLSQDSSVSLKDDILDFNRFVPGSSNCRLVRDGEPAVDRYDLTLTARDILDLNRLMLRREPRLGAMRIEEWFKPTFFDSNFWLMWATMFSFQPWHSVAEMRRYLWRFIHLFPGFTRIAGILRTRHNQYDSIIAPITQWLRGRGVQILTETCVTDVQIEGTSQDRYVAALSLGNTGTIAIGQQDCVYLTLGSMTGGSTLGGRDAAPMAQQKEAASWALWSKLAVRHEGFGRPDVFCGAPEQTAWTSFTITMDRPDFFEFMERFTTNRTGTGGLITFAGSGWLLSIVLFHQPHFRDQKQGTYSFWGYGLRGDRAGDFVNKPMWDANGNEIIEELCGQLHLTEKQKVWFDSAKINLCHMPYITSQFMPRRQGDRPAVRPKGARNFALMGQYCEQPKDCVFTVEYSIRSAWTAVAKLTGRVRPPPPVARTYLNPKVLFQASRVLLGL